MACRVHELVILKTRTFRISSLYQKHIPRCPKSGVSRYCALRASLNVNKGEEHTFRLGRTNSEATEDPGQTVVVKLSTLNDGETGE